MTIDAIAAQTASATGAVRAAQQSQVPPRSRFAPLLAQTLVPTAPGRRTAAALPVTERPTVTLGQMVAATVSAPTAPTEAAPTVEAPLELHGPVDGVPAELARYGNGRIPAAALTEIGSGNHRLWDPAARAFQAMEAAAARDGVTFGVTDSYRSYESQVDVARRKGLYSQGGLAAVPGTSKHGWGLALDLDLDAKAQAWMRDNGARFGFVENVPREPWHWEFVGVHR